MHICPGFSLRELGDDHLVIGEGSDRNIHARRVVRLNGSAAFLWRSVEGKDFGVGDLALLLREEYGIDTATSLSDAAAILDAWEKAGLVEK